MISTARVSRSFSVRSNGADYRTSPSSTPPYARRSPTSPLRRQEAFGETPSPRRRRGSSLTERFPGDMSHRPLDTLRREKAVADRSKYATKKHHIQPDTIDSLDNVAGTAYHHGGPYDATLYARNNSANSPLQAVADSNAEALKATPREKIVDSVQGRRPLDGVAAYAPGEADRNGNVYQYGRGDNMMVEGDPEGGAYKRWPGVQYHPDDVKGKGEPSYTIEKALKDYRINEKERAKSLGSDGIEMSSQSRRGSGVISPNGGDDNESKIGRNGSISKRLSGGLKKRFGSIKRNKDRE